MVARAGIEGSKATYVQSEFQRLLETEISMAEL